MVRLAFYRCRSPQPASLAQLVRVAGIRWTVEEAFQAAKPHAGHETLHIVGSD